MPDRPAEPAIDRHNRSRFERFVSAVEDVVSRPAAFMVLVLVILAWFVSAPLWHDLDTWQVVIHTFGAIIALLLLVLQRNAARRADEAQQEKLNVIAEALAALMDTQGRSDPELQSAARRLRGAVGLEERH